MVCMMYVSQGRSHSCLQLTGCDALNFNNGTLLVIRVNYHLSKYQHGQLKDMSNRTGLAVAELIRRAVDEMLKKDKKNASQASKRRQD